MTPIHWVTQVRVLLLILSGCASLASASPINRAHVAAQPQWVFHVDCDALRPTQLGQAFFAEIQKPEVQQKLAGFPVILNFDPRKSLHGLTLYSTGPYEDEPVLLVYGETNAKAFAALAATKTNHTTYRHGRNTIQSWAYQRKREARRMYAAASGPVIVYGRRAENVAAALDVLEGAASLRKSGLFPHLAQSKSPVVGATGPFQVDESQPGASLLKFAKASRFEMAEANQRVNASWTVETGSDQTAGNVASLAQGLRIVLRLQSHKPGLAKLAQHAVLTQSGANAVCSWSLPPEEAIEVLKDLIAH